MKIRQHGRCGKHQRSMTSTLASSGFDLHRIVSPTSVLCVPKHQTSLKDVLASVCRPVGGRHTGHCVHINSVHFKACLCADPPHARTICCLFRLQAVTKQLDLTQRVPRTGAAGTPLPQEALFLERPACQHDVTASSLLREVNGAVHSCHCCRHFH